MHKAAEQTLPRVFGRYLLLSRLSRGGMGEIFLAKIGEIQGFEKLCIIKKVLPHLAEDRDFIKRFIDEAQIAVKLNHANIAPVYEVGMVDGEYFLAIDYVQGRDLRRTLSRCHEEQKRIPIDIALFIAREAANGLAYAHRRTDDAGRPLNVVHCDVSPPNVLVSYEGEVKVIDFGIAKSAMRVSETNPKVGFGKFGYMAPEQLLRGGIIDRRTDIYACGVVLYELLTGERLFTFPEGADYRTIARTVAAGRAVPPSARFPDLAGLDDVVLRALQTDPKLRYQTGEELRDALQEKLVRRSPTFSSDRAGGFLRELFADEITDERELVASAKAADMAPFRNQLTGARAHTVSFALIADGDTGAVPQLPGAPEPTSPSITETVQEQPRKRRLMPLVAAAAGGAALVAVVLFFLLRGDKQAAASRAGQDTTPRQLVVTHLNAPPDPSPSASAPPTASPSPSPSVAVKPSPTASPRREPDRKPKASPSAPALTQSDVQSKFRTVSREYNAFKRDFGPRLESEWNDIVELVTYGGADKLSRVDALLDRLRKQMSQIRKDQG